MTYYHSQAVELVEKLIDAKLAVVSGEPADKEKQRKEIEKLKSDLAESLDIAGMQGPAVAG